jgi:hypothetical protein
MRMRTRVMTSTLTLAVTATMFGSSAAYANCDPSTERQKHHTEHADFNGEVPRTSKATITAVVAGLPGQEAPATATLDGAIDYKALQGAFAVTQDDGMGTTMTSELIIDGTSVYTKVPAEALPQTGGKPWIKVDAAQAGESLGVDFALLTDAGNPEASNEMMDTVGTEITYVGRDRVRDVRTRHYEVALDFAAAAEAETDPAKKQELATIAAVYGNEPVVADVWVDRKDRIRKMSFTLDLSKMQLPETTGAEQQQVAGTIELTAEFFDFGTEVDVVAPPADQVFEAPVVQEELPAPQAAA